MKTSLKHTFMFSAAGALSLLVVGCNSPAETAAENNADAVRKAADGK
jgi:hypothetical protein